MCAQSHKHVGSFEVSDSTDMWIKCLSCVLRSIYSINPFFPLEVLVVFMFNQLSIAALRIWYARASDWPDSPELRLEPEFIWNMWIDNERCLQVLLALEWLSYRSWVTCYIIHWNCVRLQSDADWVLLMVCSPQSFTFGWHRCVKNVATLVISSTQPLIHHSICHITDWSFGCWQCLWVRHLIWDDFIARSVLPVPVLVRGLVMWFCFSPPVFCCRNLLELKSCSIEDLDANQVPFCCLGSKVIVTHVSIKCL